MNDMNLIIEAASAITMVAGVAIGVAAYVIFARKRRQIAESYRTTGEVVDVKERPGGESGPLRHPVVKFVAMNGAPIVFESKFGAEYWRVKKGDRLDILVNRHDSSDAEIFRFVVQWGRPLVLAIIASSLMEGAALMFFMFVKR